MCERDADCDDVIKSYCSQNAVQQTKLKLENYHFLTLGSNSQGGKTVDTKKCQTLKVIIRAGLIAEALTEQNGVVSLD